jgi:hypothetical protein
MGWVLVVVCGCGCNGWKVDGGYYCVIGRLRLMEWVVDQNGLATTHHSPPLIHPNVHPPLHIPLPHPPPHPPPYQSPSPPSKAS